MKEAKSLFHTAGPEFEPVKYDTSSHDSFDLVSQSDTAVSDEAANERRYYDDVEPVARDPEVVTSDTRSATEELPPPKFTRSLLAKFKSLEDISKPPPTPEHSQSIQQEAVNAVKVAPKYTTSHSSSVGGAEDTSLNTSREFYDVYDDNVQASPPQQQQQRHNDGGDSDEQGSASRRYDYYDDMNAEGGEYENEPVANPDVMREQDQTEADKLPEKGTARNLMAKWQAMQGNSSWVAANLNVHIMFWDMLLLPLWISTLFAKKYLLAWL